ncbi:unnamed protein product [Schistosoma bovis]|nr:unnamed protein product [Schistosoma bovis]
MGNEEKLFRMSCYHQGKEKYGIVYSQGTGLAPNQLLIIVADSSRTQSDKCTHVNGQLVDTHPSTGRGQDIEPYCGIPNEPKCAGYENGVGICALYQHDNQLDEKYQYMDNLFPFNDTQKRKYGGHMAFDYCPVLIVQSNEHNKSYLCEQKSEIKPDSISNMFMEYRGPNSACFNDQKQKYVNISGTYIDEKKPSCHKAFQCPVEGGPLHIEQQVGNGNVLIDIQCPKCTSLCKEYCPK